MAEADFLTMANRVDFGGLRDDVRAGGTGSPADFALEQCVHQR